MTNYIIVLAIGIVVGFCLGNEGIRTKLFEYIKKSMTSKKPPAKPTRKYTRKNGGN
jgi:hypothetical protein